MLIAAEQGAPLVVLAVVVAAAAWLACAPPSRLPVPEAGAFGGGSVPGRGARAAPLAVVAAVAGAVIVVAEGEALALGLIITGGAAGAWRLAASARARKAAQETADRVVEVCEALAGELRAGQPPLPALRHCAEVWPPLVEAATAAELGSDVARALHRLAEVPGAAGLHEVAAAWQVSQRAGGSMAPALASVADSARRRRATERLVASELASAQATARLVAVLPVVVLAMGSGLGGDPWGFLLTSPVGICCLGAGLALAFLGLSWIERIATTAVHG